MHYQSFVSRPAFKRTLLAAALVGASASSWALPVFTFNPGAVGLPGAAVTADNILLSDFFRVTPTGATTFTETGFLSITGFQLGGTNVFLDGLNSTYSLYIPFTATGRTTVGVGADPRTTLTGGVVDTLTWSLVGAVGNTTFSTAGGNPTVINSGATQTLGSGSLINGNVGTSPANNNTAFVPTASVTASFAQAAGKEAFFSPQPFYDVAISAFTNSVSTVTPIGAGFVVSNGGGNLNFTTPIPEPETYALMMAGLGVLGFIARRRKRNPAV